MRRLMIGIMLLPTWIGSSQVYREPGGEQEYSTEVPQRQLRHDDLSLKRKNGRLYQDSSLYSGYLMEYFDEGSPKRLTPYLAGKMHGLVRAWYQNGALRQERLYWQGKREGVHRGWWEDGTAQFEYHFNKDLHEGRAREWFADGSLYRESHYARGQEEGSQRMWRPDGSLRANYVVRDSRRYGLLGAKPCAGPNDYEA